MTAGSVGQRIREAREALQMTQLDLAKHLGLSRAGVSQWEGDVTSPSIEKVGQIARFLDKSAEWIAYGVSTKPQIVREPPEGTVAIKEIVFGDKATEQQATGAWTLPISYLKADLHVMSTEGLLIWRAESDSMAPAIEFGDRVIVDTNAKRISPPGMFLIWDGVGPTLARIHLSQVDKQTARVVTSSNGSDGEDVPIENIHIIGRVRGRVHAS